MTSSLAPVLRADRRRGPRTGPFIARSVEPLLPIRLIALDIDGTLVDDDLALRDRTVTAIRRALRHGIHVSLVTGRMTSSATRFAETLGLSGPVIGYQGALIREMPSQRGGAGRLLHHWPLQPLAAQAAVIWSREHGLDPHLNHLERLVIRDDDPRVDDYSAFLGARATRVPDLAAWIQKPVTKVVAVGPPDLPASLLDEARATFAGRADATVAHPRFLEFVAPGVSKGAAIRWLARRAGVPMGAVMAIGDQLNDFEMLAAAGHGVAMPSAPEAVRNVARYEAPPLAVEGAAQMIERLALATPREAAAASRDLAAEATAKRGTPADPVADPEP
ncbi:MAG: Cof-type HAD-IIB family hydrolase [Chloroflexota bacterium]